MNFFIVLNEHLIEHFLVFLGSDGKNDVFKIDLDVVKNFTVGEVLENFDGGVFEVFEFFGFLFLGEGVELEGGAGGFEVVQVAFFGLFFFVVYLKNIIYCRNIWQIFLINSCHFLHISILHTF